MQPPAAPEGKKAKPGKSDQGDKGINLPPGLRNKPADHPGRKAFLEAQKAKEEAPPAKKKKPKKEDD